MGCRSPVEVESSVRRFCEGGDRASCAGRHKQARSRRRNRRNAAGGGPRDGHGGRTTRREPTRQPTPARSPPAATSPPPARAAGWLRPPTHRPRAGPFPPKTLTSRGVAAPAALAAAAAAGRGDGRRHGAAPAPAAVLPAGGRREEREPRPAGFPPPSLPPSLLTHAERGAVGDGGERGNEPRPAPGRAPTHLCSPQQLQPPQEIPRQPNRVRALSRAFWPMGRRDHNGSAQQREKGGDAGRGRKGGRRSTLRAPEVRVAACSTWYNSYRSTLQGTPCATRRRPSSAMANHSHPQPRMEPPPPDRISRQN